MADCLIHIPHKQGLLSDAGLDAELRENWSQIERYINEIAPQCFGGGGGRWATVGIAASDVKTPAGWDVHCSGTNDDVTILNAIEDWLLDDGFGGKQGGIVLSEGTFNFGHVVGPGYDKISILGQGARTVIDFSSSADPQAILLQSQCKITDMAFVGPTGNVQGAYVQDFSKIERCWFQDCGAYLAGRGGHVSNCFVTGTTQYGIYLAGETGIAMSNTVYDATFSTAGIYIGGSKCVVVGNTADTITGTFVDDVAADGYVPVGGNPLI